MENWTPDRWYKPPKSLAERMKEQQDKHNELRMARMSYIEKVVRFLNPFSD